MKKVFLFVFSIIFVGCKKQVTDSITTGENNTPEIEGVELLEREEFGKETLIISVLTTDNVDKKKAKEIFKKYSEPNKITTVFFHDDRSVNDTNYYAYTDGVRLFFKGKEGTRIE